MALTCRLNLQELNSHLLCSLCSGYLIDATTIIECLHSFCKTCLVNHLQKTKFCPTCEVQIHKTKPLENVRADKALQALVYKLVPGLLHRERQRRRDFYDASKDCKDVNLESSICTFGDIKDGEVAYYPCGDDDPMEEDYAPDRTPEEFISLCMQHCDRPPPFRYDDEAEKKCDKRFLLCPSAITIGHLKKFIQMKFELPDSFQISIYHSDQSLANMYTLIDIVSIYTWRKVEPLRLYYTVWDGKAHSNQLTPPCPSKVINTDFKGNTPSKLKRKLSELTPEEKREFKKCKLEKLRRKTKKLKMKLKKTSDEKLKEKLKKRLRLKRKIAGELEEAGEEGDEMERILKHGRKHKKKLNRKLKREEEKCESEKENKDVKCDVKSPPVLRQMEESPVIQKLEPVEDSAVKEAVKEVVKEVVMKEVKKEVKDIKEVVKEVVVVETPPKSGKENNIKRSSTRLRHSKRKTAMDTKKKLITRRILRRKCVTDDRNTRISQLKLKLSRLKRNLSNHDKPGWLRRRKKQT
ncbi:hypothetical protein CAPTEDRAFT_227017 [Capitella teleta]|uniref:RING-type domain-containing protein n=1 Tax=Capitella teleta TaxID=283909 RepID=R7TSP8_CAPTE|nr:hypothetical protein CAPTEDRAFT_227017 [Capitella teleta]|eukprot:ELT94511.1 hypothetical protein CAPTEDRAFT_227017 [Capitella teleta]